VGFACKSLQMPCLHACTIVQYCILYSMLVLMPMLVLVLAVCSHGPDPLIAIPAPMCQSCVNPVSILWQSCGECHFDSTPTSKYTNLYKDYPLGKLPLNLEDKTLQHVKDSAWWYRTPMPQNALNSLAPKPLGWKCLQIQTTAQERPKKMLHSYVSMPFPPTCQPTYPRPPETANSHQPPVPRKTRDSMPHLSNSFVCPQVIKDRDQGSHDAIVHLGSHTNIVLSSPLALSFFMPRSRSSHTV
jgi:hypothetical protein